MKSTRSARESLLVVLLVTLSLGTSPPTVHAAKRPKSHPSCKLCDSVAALLDTLRAVHLSKARGTDTLHPCLGKTRPICAFIWNGTFTDFAPDAAPHDILAQQLERTGWSQLLECMADGPDGTSMTFTRDSVAVVIEAQWDGGDNSDPNYVPQNFYNLRILCGCRRQSPKPR